MPAGPPASIQRWRHFCVRGPAVGFGRRFPVGDWTAWSFTPPRVSAVLRVRTGPSTRPAAATNADPVSVTSSGRVNSRPRKKERSCEVVARFPE